MAFLKNTRLWIPDCIAAMPFLLGMGLVIAYDALTPYLSFTPDGFGIGLMDLADFVRTVAFLVAALFARKVRMLFRHPVFLGFGCCAASLAVVMVEAMPLVQSELLRDALSLVCVLAIGIFWSGAALKFFELFTYTSLGNVIAAYTICHLVGSSIATLIVELDLRLVAIALLALIPLALFAMGYFSKSLVCRGASGEVELAGASLRIPVRPFALMLATLFVAAMVRSRIPEASEPLTYFGPLLCAIALVAIMECKGKALRPRTLYYVTLILLLVGLLLITLDSHLAYIASGGCVNAGYLSFDVLITGLLCNVCRRYQVNPYWMFGLLGFVERLAYDAGTSAGNVLLSQSEGIRNFIYFACAVVVVVAFVTLLTERDYRTSWGAVKDEMRINPVTSYYQSLPEMCANLSEQYGLTRREEEITLLLAQRKTLPDIERELYISNSTVKTHCKNIYKKLGIHKREELLALMGHPAVRDGDSSREG